MVLFGVSTGAWKDLLQEKTSSAAPSGGGGVDGPDGQGQNISVLFSPLSQFDKGAGITATTFNVTDLNTRFVGIDAGGKSVVGNAGIALNLESTRQQTIVFPNHKPKDIKSVKLQGRVYQWSTFSLPVPPAK